VPETYVGEKVASLTNGTEKTGCPCVEDKDPISPLYKKSTENGSKTLM
jgi:hypothetical protein